MSDWPKYISHKIVSAAPIVGMKAGTVDTPACLLVSLPDGSTESFIPTETAMLLHAGPGDYAMRYHDGFRSVCPKKAFEDGYSSFTEVQP